ncbi:MAG: hypothetical protein F6K40_14795 [Okeania sp. SIO3I5]|uniref:hypothetical protein n=1 Tax=Okeania sp. SIO3I5 TaxID=2607805 RepID=UPI0013BCFC0A|nr:hypothetical protein [Okeania sp. SIO3I5]NEQ37465.1 hypothetical protein [Okeania sp. SIO3I5]
MYKKHWLNLAEYATIVISALGAFGVAVSGQAFYAVAPMTLALSLNVANRYRFEQQMLLSQKSEIGEIQSSVEKLEQNAVKVIVKLRQQLSYEIESVSEKFTTDNIQVVDSEIQQQLSALENSVSSVQKSLASVDKKALNNNDWEIVNGRLLVIEEAIANLQKDMQVFAKEPQADISQLQAKIDDLEIQNTQVVKPHLKRLITLVRQLQNTNYSSQSSHQSVISKQPIREHTGESFING